MERFQNQEQEEEKKKEHAEGKKTEKRCKKCGAVLDPDSIFCPECGEKIDGEDRECPDCKTVTSADYCPNCGYKMSPSFCPNCGTETHHPFCIECGTIVDESFAAAMEQEEEYKEKAKKEAEKEPEPVMVTEEEAKQFEEEVKASVSEELKYFTKKIAEHKILKQEREYFNAREKRIVKVLGKNNLQFSLPDPDELAYNTKIYNELKKIMVERREKANREELERLFPDIYKAQQNEKVRQQQLKEQEEARKKEFEEKQKELEEKYKNLEEEISKEINEAFAKEEERKQEELRRRREMEEKKRQEMERLRKEAEEKKRKEEEERRRREQEYQKKLEEQRKKERLGIWVAACDNNTFIKITAFSGEKVRGLSDGLNHDVMHVSGFFSGVVRGTAINLIFEKYTKTDPVYTHCDTFFGQFTPDGNIRGGWTNNLANYYDLWYKFN